MTEERHVCGSPGWLGAICQLIEDQITDSGADLGGLDFVWGEEFTHLPDWLHDGRSASVGWTAWLEDGVVRTAPTPPPDDADRVVVVEWEPIEPAARHTFGIDEDGDAAMRRMVAELEATGRLRRIVRREEPPALRAALHGDGHQLHNRAVAFTAPPPQ